MPAAVGPGGATYLWRDGSTSSLAPPSDSIDVVLQNPTQWAIENGTAISYDKLYREQEFVGGACRFIADQIARLPLKRFIAVDDGDAVRDRKSLFARALRKPAPRRTRHALKRSIALDLAVNGNHLEEIVFAKGRMELHAIQWRFVRPKYNEARTRIDGWEIHDQGPGVKPRNLSNFDVIHFALGSTDGLLGISPLEQLGIALRIDRAAAAHQLASLRNGAKMGVVVVIDPTLAKDSGIVESVRHEFQARYSGPPNSGRPFVAGGIDVKTIPQQTLVEAELLNQRRVSREAVSAVTQLPTSFLGDMAKATQNNFKETYRQLFKTTLPAYLDNIAQTFDCHALDEHPHIASEDSYTEFDVSAVLFGDPIERGEAYEHFLGVGALTINDIRELENRAKYDDPIADKPMLKISNYQSADKADDVKSGDAPPPGE